MIIDCIADLHGHYPQLEGGDLLIVAGDLTARNDEDGYCEFFHWLCKQNYKKKIFIAGNHDASLHEYRITARNGSSEGVYLCDSGCQIFYPPDPKPLNQDCLDIQDLIPQKLQSLKVWGSPWTKRFKGMNQKCMAFTVETEEELAEKWAMIPDDTDILVTHCPPLNMFDEVEDYSSGKILNVGSRSLLKWQADHVSTLKLHIWGHVHEGHGVFDIRKSQKELNGNPGPVYINASHVNELYEPVNKPIRIEL